MHKINIYYINTDYSTDRRERLEKNFSECGFSENWTLTRVKALTPDDEAVMNRPTDVSLKLVANYLSHLECITKSKENDDHAFISEDDTQFGKSTEHYVNIVLASLNEDDWDIIFTDIYVGDVLFMPKLFKRRARCSANNMLVTCKASNWEGGFGGAGAYIVNRRSKDKMLAVMQHHEHILNAYDMILKHYATHEIVRAIIAFPFLTTVSDTGDVSTVAPGHRDTREATLLHYFRRLVWMDADYRPEAMEELLERLKPLEDAFATPATRALSAIVSPLMAIQQAWDSEMYNKISL